MSASGSRISLQGGDWDAGRGAPALDDAPRVS